MGYPTHLPVGLSAVIVVKDAAPSIDRCLRSVAWVSETLVADTGSTDQTVEICHRFPCRVLHAPWLGFGPTKQWAVDQAAHDWVLSVDADEEVSEALAHSIAKALQNPSHPAYRVPRRSWYLGKPVRFSSWQSDKPVRLFHRARARFNDKPVHEGVVVRGTVGNLEGFLWHEPYPDVATHVRKMLLYSTLAAPGLQARRYPVTVAEAFVRAWAKFLKMYVLRCGFLDGRTGLVLAATSSFGVYLKYVVAWERSRRSST